MNNQNTMYHAEESLKQDLNYVSENGNKAVKSLTDIKVFLSSLTDTGITFLGLFLSIQLYSLSMTLFSHNDGFFKTFTQDYFLPVIRFIYEYRYLIIILLVALLIKIHYLKIRYALEGKVKKELNFYILAGLIVELLFVFLAVIGVGHVVASVHQIPALDYFRQLAGKKATLYLLVFSFPFYFLPSFMVNGLIIAAGILKKSNRSFSRSDRKPAFLMTFVISAVFYIWILISLLSFNWVGVLYQILFVSKPAI